MYERNHIKPYCNCDVNPGYTGRMIESISVGVLLVFAFGYAYRQSIELRQLHRDAERDGGDGDARADTIQEWRLKCARVGMYVWHTHFFLSQSVTIADGCLV